MSQTQNLSLFKTSVFQPWPSSDRSFSQGCSSACCTVSRLAASVHRRPSTKSRASRLKALQGARPRTNLPSFMDWLSTLILKQSHIGYILIYYIGSQLRSFLPSFEIVIKVTVQLFIKILDFDNISRSSLREYIGLTVRFL